MKSNMMCCVTSKIT